jgi:hypothetical protein
MTRTPPRIPLWLLEHLSAAARREAVVGDLVERYGDGESRGWFWRQALLLIAADLGQAVRVHGLTFIAALVVAYAVVFASHVLGPPIQDAITSWRVLHLWEIDPLWTESAFWRSLFTVVSFGQVLIWYFVAGWIVPHVHRAHPRLIVWTYAAVHVVLTMPWTIRLVENLMTHPRYLNSLLWQIGMTCATTAAIIVSGLWAVRRMQSRKENIQQPSRGHCR